MNATTQTEQLDVGFDVPAVPGMDESQIQTPCLILDLDALERSRADAQVANDSDWAGQLQPALVRARVERLD